MLPFIDKMSLSLFAPIDELITSAPLFKLGYFSSPAGWPDIQGVLQAETPIGDRCAVFALQIESLRSEPAQPLVGCADNGQKLALASLPVYEDIMRAVTAIFCALLFAIFVAACNRSRVDGASRPGPGEIEREFDTNGDGHPDLAKFYKDNQLIRVERDRNFDGKPDLIQEYDRGIIAREIHDDDFDGKPEMIKIFRKGALAIFERDPLERGSIDIAEYYDDHGNLVRREVRH